MGQQNCCELVNKQQNQITQDDIDNYKFDKLDYSRPSTYKKLESIATEITTTGILILAGGKNMRYDQTKIKSLTPLDIPSQKNMFQLIAEKITKLNLIASNGKDTQSTQIQVYVMTTDDHFIEVKEYWKKNNFFGIDKSCITFFLQSTFPVLDLQGQILMKKQYEAQLSPNGPADFFPALLSFGILKKMLKQKIKYLHIVGVENILLKPLDPLLLGYAKLQDKDFICKVVDRSPNDNDAQFFVQRSDDTVKVVTNQEIIQYLENTKSSQKNTNNNINNIQKQQNLSDAPVFMHNLVVKTDFLNQIAGDPGKKYKLAQQFHVIKRSLDWYDWESQSILQPQQPNAYIFERQIGDMIALTGIDKVKLLKVNRTEEYSPIIYPLGIYSPEEAKTDLSNLHKKWLGLDERNYLESQILEISPLVSYNGEQLDPYISLIQNVKQLQFPLHIQSYQQLQHEIQQMKMQQSQNGKSQTQHKQQQQQIQQQLQQNKVYQQKYNESQNQSLRNSSKYQINNASTYHNNNNNSNKNSSYQVTRKNSNVSTKQQQK
ncbi:hypothetical protein PPERSA_08852 [Pseudocohnilembus persalinus]|uniref:UDP-N-acetylglucosamine diphosphorylase n=1 Tax=Pseudocohnilembus persalinus TaxID=266149 RepID=A0A0V0R463_PSEPJ|nr:hypothetical protein PPERSA_08852 [Pseudocohnilembus persalinus]|eukprot:KRX09136.1 hypothetical protein PPERSA_08852 [Pseudocohnilembus persalinus]